MHPSFRIFSWAPAAQSNLIINQHSPPPLRHAAVNTLPPLITMQFRRKQYQTLCLRIEVATNSRRLWTSQCPMPCSNQQKREPRKANRVAHACNSKDTTSTRCVRLLNYRGGNCIAIPLRQTSGHPQQCSPGDSPNCKVHRSATALFSCHAE